MLNPENGQAMVIPMDFMVLQRFSALVVVNNSNVTFLFVGHMSIYTPDSSIGNGRYDGAGQIGLF
jgi:hypothetical protein